MTSDLVSVFEAASAMRLEKSRRVGAKDEEHTKYQVLSTLKILENTSVLIEFVVH